MHLVAWRPVQPVLLPLVPPVLLLQAWLQASSFGLLAWQQVFGGVQLAPLMPGLGQSLLAAQLAEVLQPLRLMQQLAAALGPSSAQQQLQVDGRRNIPYLALGWQIHTRPFVH